ncbi:MAG: GreA/GreB family elongation factor [Patescibacteria group bacterium]
MENKFYLTKEGADKIQKEYTKLLEFRQLKTKDEMPSLLHSEEINPEYLLFQEDMSLLETRIAEYENILNNIEIIKPPEKEKCHIVHFGARVTVDLDGEIDEFTIVGTLEADPMHKRISNESPIGKALMGAKVGDTVIPQTSMVRKECRVLKIHYQP